MFGRCDCESRRIAASCSHSTIHTAVEMNVPLREVTSGAGGYANVSLNMQLELHISAIVVRIQLLWYGYVDNNGMVYWCETEPVVVCCVFVFIGKCCCKLHYCGVWRLRTWPFSLPVFASGNIFCSQPSSLRNVVGVASKL